MAITFGNVQNTDYVYQAGAATLAVDFSALSVSSGQLILVLAQLDGISSLTTPSGYTQTSHATNAAGTIATYTKVSDGTETSVSIAVSGGGTDNVNAIVAKLGGADGKDVSGFGTGGGGSNWSTPTLTTTVDGCMIFAGGGTVNSTNYTAGDEPDSTTLVHQGDAGSSWFGVTHWTQGTAGSTAGNSFNLWTNTSQSKHSFAIAIAPTSDVTEPTLSSPTGAADGAFSALGSVDTDEGNGTLYWVVTQSATSPSVTQIQAGQNDVGTAADASGSQAVSATGTQNVGTNGLSASTTYFFHFQHQDAASNDSTVSSSTSFDTGSSSAGMLLKMINSNPNRGGTL